MRIRDIINIVAGADLPSQGNDARVLDHAEAEAVEALDEAKPLTAQQWRKHSAKQQRIAQQKRDEMARHAKKLRDLSSKSASL